ncbi:MAG: TIM barrel protein [Promethearchaeota archaeon]
MKIRVGPAAIPTVNLSLITEMIKDCQDNRFTALELEFVRITASEYPSSEIMKNIAISAHERNIQLSIHGSLYINLATLEESKVAIAKEHINQGIRVSTAASANLIFHAGYFQNLAHDIAIKKAITLLNSLQIPNPSKIFLETPGKLNSIGNLSELLEIAAQTGIQIGIDWGHHYARTHGGGIKEPADILNVITTIENSINQKFFHMHISGIEYTKKGEKKHRSFANSEFPLEIVIQTLQEVGISGTFICESPERWKGDTELIIKLLYGEKVFIPRKKRTTLYDYFR